MDGILDQLLTRAKAGDKMTEEELFGYLFVRFRTIAKRRIGEQDAEDVAQEACLTVLEKYKTATYARGFAAWAYEILRNKIGNYWRKKGKGMKPKHEIHEATDTSVKNPDSHLKMKLLKCLRQLVKESQDYARVLNLSYQGYTTKEICQRLGIKPNNCYVILYRARHWLKTCLERGVI
jgi:RNA polymerase sigma factor (sigma-70 family)